MYVCVYVCVFKCVAQSMNNFIQKMLPLSLFLFLYFEMEVTRTWGTYVTLGGTAKKRQTHEGQMHSKECPECHLIPEEGLVVFTYANFQLYCAGFPVELSLWTSLGDCGPGNHAVPALFLWLCFWADPVDLWEPLYQFGAKPGWEKFHLGSSIWAERHQ